LSTIAPPRTGKTSGLLIPNLLVANPSAWNGVAIVIDPKGDAYRATAQRRRALKRNVRCLDPMSIVGGLDTWNPVALMLPTDILYLQRVARALLPAVATDSDATYFQNRAVDVIVGAFLAAHAMQRPSPRTVAKLLSNPDWFEKVLEPITTVAAELVKSILKMDPRGRDSILSTAAQAFSWCADSRLQKMTSNSSFSLSDLCDGNTDLYITLPTEDIKTLTPLLRWLLCDLFMTVRRQRPLESIVCFIDECAALGRFEELLVGAGELPGYNFRLWTFWQARSQMSRIYGDDGARTLLNTADIVTYSDLSLVEPDEREFMSKAIGDYTLLDRVETLNEGVGKGASVSYNPIAMRLITTDGVGQIPNTQLIVLPNSAHYAKRPLLIRKTRFDDPRLKPFKA
jgi:type IV secretion system protein VirD4